MTPDEYKEIRKLFIEDFADDDQIKASNKLLKWSMGQLRRSARTIDTLLATAGTREEGNLPMETVISDVTADIIQHVLEKRNVDLSDVDLTPHWFDE
jgi:hypothetical protein